MMKLLLGSSLLFLATHLPAQDLGTVPVGEAGFSWSYLRLGENAGRAGNIPGGWKFSLTGNVTPWLGFTGEFSGHYGDREFPIFSPAETFALDVDTNVHTFLFGPRVFYRDNPDWTPFGHVLFGAARINTDIGDFGPFASPIQETETPLALLLGGGFDLHTSERISIRAIQVDYLLTRPSDTNINSLRISVGLNYKWY
jgi:hypothetical protein